MAGGGNKKQDFCVDNGTRFAIGEEWSDYGICNLKTCQRGGHISIKTCPIVEVPAGCYAMGGNLDNEFPHCCPSVECPWGAGDSMSSSSSSSSEGEEDDLYDDEDEGGMEVMKDETTSSANQVDKYGDFQNKNKNEENKLHNNTKHSRAEVGIRNLKHVEKDMLNIKVSDDSVYFNDVGPNAEAGFQKNDIYDYLTPEQIELKKVETFTSNKKFEATLEKAEIATRQVFRMMEKEAKRLPKEECMPDLEKLTDEEIKFYHSEDFIIEKTIEEDKQEQVKKEETQVVSDEKSTDAFIYNPEDSVGFLEKPHEESKETNVQSTQETGEPNKQNAVNLPPSHQDNKESFVQINDDHQGNLTDPLQRDHANENFRIEADNLPYDILNDDEYSQMADTRVMPDQVDYKYQEGDGVKESFDEIQPTSYQGHEQIENNCENSENVASISGDPEHGVIDNASIEGVLHQDNGEASHEPFQEPNASEDSQTIQNIENTEIS